MDRGLSEHRSLGAARMSASAFRYVLRPGRNGALRKLRRQALNALAQCGSSRRMHAADQFLRLRGGGRQQGGSIGVKGRMGSGTGFTRVLRS